MPPIRINPRIRPAPPGRPTTIGQVQAMQGGNYGGISGAMLNAIGRGEALRGGIHTLLNLGGHDYYNDIHAEKRQDALMAAHYERERQRQAEVRQEKEDAQREAEARQERNIAGAEHRVGLREGGLNERAAARRQAEADRQTRGIEARRGTEDRAAAAHEAARASAPQAQENDRYGQYEGARDAMGAVTRLPFGLGDKLRAAEDAFPVGTDPTFGSKQAFGEQKDIRGEAWKRERAATTDAQRAEALSRAGTREAGIVERNKAKETRMAEAVKRVMARDAAKIASEPERNFVSIRGHIEGHNQDPITGQPLHTEDEITEMAREQYRQTYGKEFDPTAPAPGVRPMEPTPEEAPPRSLPQRVAAGIPPTNAPMPFAGPPAPMGSDIVTPTGPRSPAQEPALPAAPDATPLLSAPPVAPPLTTTPPTPPAQAQLSPLEMQAAAKSLEAAQPPPPAAQIAPTGPLSEAARDALTPQPQVGSVPESLPSRIAASLAPPPPDPTAGALADMIRSGKVTLDDALAHTDVPEEHKAYLRSAFGGGDGGD